MWNDPKIAADNPGVTLPANDITVVHRSDGSGTSAVFTDYLSKVVRSGKRKSAPAHRRVGPPASGAKEMKA